MSVVLFVLLTATVLAAVALLVSMYVKNKPLSGAIAIGLLLGPGTVLAFLLTAFGQG